MRDGRDVIFALATVASKYTFRLSRLCSAFVPLFAATAVAHRSKSLGRAAPIFFGPCTLWQHGAPVQFPPMFAKDKFSGA